VLKNSGLNIMRSLNGFKRLFFIFAALWSIGASIYLLLTPVTVQEVIAEGFASGEESIEQVSRQVSWYEVQGLWGVFVLIIFALLFSSIGVFATRSRHGALAIFSFLAITLTILATFSIGPLYFPAVLAVSVGWILLGLEKVLGLRDQTSG
jgi:hypothetical protein